MPDDDRKDELLRQFEAAILGMGLDDLRRLALDLPARAGREPLRPSRPGLRRPPRAEPAVFRLRVDLDHARPPIWRRLDVRSDLTLDVIHQVLQAAFGWTDSHLHRFSLGGGPFDQHSELFLCPYDVEEGDDGSPASGVRLDETLQEPGDVLRYVYDYGDSWELTLRLEQVLATEDGAPPAICVDGRRAAPPEDCGGITDERDLAEVLPDPAHFDVAEINDALNGSYFVLGEYGVHPRLVEMVTSLTFTEMGDDIVARTRALVTPAPEPTPEQMGTALRAHLWFLERARGGGIELTSAGYLKPADVEAASALVPAMGDWYGKNNREINAVPLLRFRQSLQSSGLLRKSKGKLLLTRAGSTADGDPERLWQHLAARLVPGKPGFDQDATLLLLVYIATSGDAEVPLERVAEALGHLGWRQEGGQAPDTLDLHMRDAIPLGALRNVSARPRTFQERDRFGPVAVALARAALRDSQR